MAAMKVALFCDVLWNGMADANYLLVPNPAPAGMLRIAWIVFDSDELPRQWTTILNDRFDLVLTTAPHLLGTLRRSAVDTPAACLPIPLDLAPTLARPLYRAPGPVRFGSVAAFHPRKGIETAIEAFTQAFAGNADATLTLHSNITAGETFDRVTAMCQAAGGAVALSQTQLAPAEKDRLIGSFDVLVNCSRGEAYSIGPREALAAGCVLVLSDIGGHRELGGTPGVFLVPAELDLPARYPEIDGMVFGRQRGVMVPKVAQALRAAYDFVRSGQAKATVHQRRAAAAAWSFDHLATVFASLIDEYLLQFRRTPLPPSAVLPEPARAVVRGKLGPRAGRLRSINRLTVVGHDGGLFSVFNAFTTHLVWAQRELRCHSLTPDWDVGRMLSHLGKERFLSFCYGQPGDGNIWCHLFEPPFGFSDAELNDPAVLYERSTHPVRQNNEAREPDMTYVHAYRLYQSDAFRMWRRLYHRITADHIRLRPSLQAQVDAFSAQHFDGRFVIAAHVRHPSHTTEQPGAVIAHQDAYIRRIYAELARRGLGSDGWTVFLATDQDRVVNRFKAEFGERLAWLHDVRRTSDQEDQVFDQLSPGERNVDGYQLQHVVARDPANWSTNMAREVVRDAWLMARCNMLLHVVSNVSTAVSYLNPAVEMVFCSAEPDAAAAR